MEFTTRVRTFAEKARERKTHIKSEHGLEVSIIQPFLGEVLGYDVGDPQEVIPQYGFDTGFKDGTKVDYAVIMNRQPVLLVEAKLCANEALGGSSHLQQLRHYFANTDVNIGILTNGFLYHFYSDLDKSHIMDLQPFFEIDLENLTDRVISNLEIFTKDKFMSSTAREKAMEIRKEAEIGEYFTEQVRTLSDDEFTKCLIRAGTTVQVSKRDFERYRPMVRRVIDEFMGNLIENENIGNQAPLQILGIAGITPEIKRFVDAIIEIVATEAVKDDISVQVSRKIYIHCGVYCVCHLNIGVSGNVVSISFYDENGKTSSVSIKNTDEITTLKENIIMATKSAKKRDCFAEFEKEALKIIRQAISLSAESSKTRIYQHLNFLGVWYKNCKLCSLHYNEDKSGFSDIQFVQPFMEDGCDWKKRKDGDRCWLNSAEEIKNFSDRLIAAALDIEESFKIKPE